MVTALTGTGWLFLLALRRDRILLPVWLLSICGIAAAVVNSVTALYTDAQERASAAAFGAANVASRIFDGPASGTDIGAMSMVEAYLILAILVSLMSAQAVTRHTRQDEETGRAELLGATVIGRHARLTAALLLAVGANLLLGGMIALVLIGHDLDPGGALVAGGAVTGAGVTFAGIAAVCAQLSESQRGANLLSAAVLGAAFLLRALGDALGQVASNQVEVVSAWPSWLSPLGWGHQLRPFYQNNGEIFALYGGLFVVLVGTAFLLSTRRDMGAALMATRPGPASAAAGLHTPLGLAWRLNRGTLLAWTVGMSIIGGAFGAVGNSVDDFIGISDQLEDILRAQAGGSSLVELYFSFAMGFLGVATAGYTVQALLRARAEEAAGRLEPLLATAVGRHRWLGAYLVSAAGGTVVVIGATGLSGALGYTVLTGDLGVGLGFLWAALVHVPAALVLGGFVVAMFGLVPQWTVALGWAALAVSLVMGQLGQLLELPQAVLNLSPFTHLPPVPAGSVAALPIAVLLAAAVALGAVGMLAFRRRDLAITA